VKLDLLEALRGRDAVATHEREGLVRTVLVREEDPAAARIDDYAAGRAARVVDLARVILDLAGRRVHLVLLDLGTVPNEGDADGVEREGEGRRPAIQRPLGQPPEEQQAGDAAEEGEEPERESAGTHLVHAARPRRKGQVLELTDRMVLTLPDGDDLERFLDWVKSETLAVEIEQGPELAVRKA